MNAWLEFGLSNGVAATVLALVAALATRFCRRPQVALALWLLVLAKLLAPPIVGLPAVSLRTFLPAEPESSSIDDASFDMPDNDALLAAEQQFAELASQVQLHALPTDSALEVEAPPAVDPPLVALQGALLADAALAPLRFDWLPRAIFWTWIAGSALWFAVAAARIARFARLIRRAEPAEAALQDEVRQLAQRMGLSRVPGVKVARRRVPPLVWGMSGKPTLLLPAELLESLSHEQRATLLAHELAHVARRDDLVRWFELVAIGLYWWHPVAWWARYNAEAAQEQCCDARVMGLLPHAARAYAETLLATIEFLAEPGRKVPLGASGFSQVGHMHRRLTMILKRNTSGRMSWTATASLAVLSFLVLPLSLHTLWAEPVAEGELEVTFEADVSGVADAGEVELFAEASEPEATTEDVEVEVAADAAANADEEDVDDKIDPAIERRLDRLEKMIEKLAREGRPAESAKKAGKPSAPAATKPATKSEKSGPSYIKPLMDSELELSQNWAELVRETTRDLELTKTNSHRLEAARRQVDAVIEAYRNDSTTADQVLEAIRRRAEAQASYARTVSDLSRVPARREYLLALGGWIAGEQAARDTKRLWSDAAERGRPREELDQFREQYNQLRESTQKALMKLKYVQGLPAGLQKHIAANSDEWNLGAHATKPIHVRQLELELSALQMERAVSEQKRAKLNESMALIEAQLGERQLVERATQLMQEKLDERQRKLASIARQEQQQLEFDQRSLAELAAKRAALDEEFARKAAALEARRKELVALEAMKAHDAATLKAKDLAIEKLKELKKQEVEKQQKSGADKVKPQEPHDDGGAQRGPLVPADKYKVTHLSANCRDCHSGLPKDAFDLHSGASSKSCLRLSLAQSGAKTLQEYYRALGFFSLPNGVPASH